MCRAADRGRGSGGSGRFISLRFRKTLGRQAGSGALASAQPDSRDGLPVLLKRIFGDDGGKVCKLMEACMWLFAILIPAGALFFGAHDVALAQATTPNVTPPLQGLSTPITSTVTNCMMSCNSRAANCNTGCVIPAAPTAATAGTGTLNATSNTACLMGCTSSQLACQTNCSLLSSQVGR